MLTAGLCPEIMKSETIDDDTLPQSLIHQSLPRCLKATGAIAPARRGCENPYGGYGVAVTRDDPVMILATLNDLLAKEHAEKQAQLLAQFRREMESVSEKWASDAKTMAQTILRQTQEAHHATAARQIEQAFERLEQAWAQEAIRTRAATAPLKWMLAANMFASLLTFAAACLLLMATSPA